MRVKFTGQNQEAASQAEVRGQSICRGGNSCSRGPEVGHGDGLFEEVIAVQYGGWQENGTREVGGKVPDDVGVCLLL